jgi:hypothetical protein
LTTAYPFTPSYQGRPQFTPTFDGNQYNVFLTWSLYGQRYRVDCYDLSGNLIFETPLNESPAGVQIETLSFDDLHLCAVGMTIDPHGFAVGSTTKLTISDASPDVYNGTFLVLATSANTFSYPLAIDDPGAASQPGVLSFDMSMTAGYFSSTLLYRSGVFYVTP